MGHLSRDRPLGIVDRISGSLYPFIVDNRPGSLFSVIVLRLGHYKLLREYFSLNMVFQSCGRLIRFCILYYKSRNSNCGHSQFINTYTVSVRVQMTGNAL